MKRISSSLAPCVVVLLAAGCASPEPAPEDLQALARFFFDRFDPDDVDAATGDVELQDAFAKLHVQLKGDDVTEPQKGLLDSITQAELDAVGLSDRDPKEPAGLYTTTIIHCDMDRLEEILLEPDQLSLYPEAYAEYRRTYDDDAPAYLPTWSVTYKSSENALISNQFTAHLRSGLRKVPETENAAHGRTLVGRVFLTEPATFEEPSDETKFTQDYQLETYYQRAPGEIVHFYAIWRYMKLGVLGDSYSGVFTDQTQASMIDWDKKTDELCAQ
jgi:hypothetical protein